MDWKALTTIALVAPLAGMCTAFAIYEIAQARCVARAIAKRRK